MARTVGQHLVGLSLSPIGLHCWQPGWLAAAVSVWTGCSLFPTSFLLSFPFPFPFLFLFFYFPWLFSRVLLLRLIALLPRPRVYIFFLHLFAFSFLAASVASTVFVFFLGGGFFSGYIKIFKVLKIKVPNN